MRYSKARIKKRVGEFLFSKSFTEINVHFWNLGGVD